MEWSGGPGYGWRQRTYDQARIMSETTVTAHLFLALKTSIKLRDRAFSGQEEVSNNATEWQTEHTQTRRQQRLKHL